MHAVKYAKLCVQENIGICLSGFQSNIIYENVTDLILDVL